MRLGYLPLILTCIVGTTFAAKVLTGNSTSSSTTFTFSVGPYSFYEDGSSMMTGAAEVVADNTFSVAAYFSTAEQFVPLGINTVTLNNVANQANPLTGQKIKYISVHTGTSDISIPAVVINNSTPASERFLVISNMELPKSNKPTEPKVSLVQSNIPNDAGGATCGYVVGLSSGYLFGGTNQDIVFGAVTEQGNTFGTGDSGITLAEYKLVASKGTDKAHTLTLLNAQTGAIGNLAVAFNTSTAALKVGDDLDSFEVTTLPVIDMHWDYYLQRLFIAVRVTAAAGADNGAKSIVVGRIENQKLILEKFIPDDVVLASNNDIIAGAKNGTSVSAYKVRTMNTSTGLNYLIVNGGNNAAAGIQPVANKIFAIPLVNSRSITNNSWMTSATHATAAAKNQIPTTTFNNTTHRFLMRQFITPATSYAQSTLQTDRAAIVGAGVLPLVPTGEADSPVIQDMFVSGDAVFVCIAAAYAVNQEPGIFQSRAIFDNNGCIAAWTPWQRVGGSDDYAFGGKLVARDGNFWLLTGADSTHINTVKKTLWSTGEKDGLLGGTTTDASVGLVNVLDQLFPSKFGGIQVVNDYNAYNNVVGIPHSGLTGKTVALISGYNKFAFILMDAAIQAAGTIKPYTGDFSAGLVTGTSNNFPAGAGHVFVVTGSVLHGIGPLTTQTIFSNTTHSWIALGGIHGLAILSDVDGQGFLPAAMPTDFTFKKVGNYEYVQKVIGDGSYLYILTTSSFERITINPARFANGNIEHTILATTKSLGINKYGCFSDVIIAGNLALLATSNGLFRISNGYDVKSGLPTWTPVPLGESLGPVYQFTAAASATTGLGSYSQVFALGAYQGLDEAQLYRLYLNDVTSITDSSVQTIGDLFVENIPSYFASFGQFRGGYADDGSLRLAVRPVNDPHNLALYALPPYIRIGRNSLQTKHSIPVLSGVGPQGFIGQPVRNTASGAWLLPGSFGLQVNE